MYSFGSLEQYQFIVEFLSIISIKPLVNLICICLFTFEAIHGVSRFASEMELNITSTEECVDFPSFILLKRIHLTLRVPYERAFVRVLRSR